MEADYSWLAMTASSNERRTYELPEMKRIELEQLCSRLHSSDCGTVILTFRREVDDQQLSSPELIPPILRSVVCTVRYNFRANNNNNNNNSYVITFAEEGGDDFSLLVCTSVSLLTRLLTRRMAIANKTCVSGKN